MGYSKEGNITNFTPDDTDDEMYINCQYTEWDFCGIIEKAKFKWGDDITLDELYISAENIHTRCIYYDQHDPSDWDVYLVISRK